MDLTPHSISIIVGMQVELYNVLNNWIVDIDLWRSFAVLLFGADVSQSTEAIELQIFFTETRKIKRERETGDELGEGRSGRKNLHEAESHSESAIVSNFCA